VSEHFLGLDAATLKTTPYLRTQVAVDDLVRVEGLGVFHGPAGCGKSFAVRAALARQREVETSWFDFPGRTTPKAIVRALLEEITGVRHEASRDRMEVLLLDHLAERRRVIAIDEAQQLYHEAIEYLRHLYDRPKSRVTMLLVGGHECWERVSSYHMVRSRVLEVVDFQPLAREEVLEHVPLFHPIYSAVEPELIELIDDEYAHGNLRDWTKFTVQAQALMADNELGELSAEVAQAIFELSAGGAGV
jgi:type II secretory pathway predicted ATPase ExeA